MTEKTETETTTISVDLVVRAELGRLQKYPKEKLNDVLRRVLGLEEKRK